MEQFMDILPQMELFHFANTLTYALFAALPLNLAMTIVGFIHKGECQLNDDVPRYLFFGGLGGLSTLLLRMVLVLTWRHIVKKSKGPE